MHRKRASDFLQELLDSVPVLVAAEQPQQPQQSSAAATAQKRVAEEPDCVVDEALSAPQRHVAQSLGIEAGESSRPRRAKLFRVPFCGLRLLAHWAFAPAFSVRSDACSGFIGGNSSPASRPSS